MTSNHRHGDSASSSLASFSSRDDGKSAVREKVGDTNVGGFC